MTPPEPAPRHRRYPAAYRSGTTETLHGHRVADHYRWLEDSDDPDTARWCDEQEGLYRAHLAGWSTREWFERHMDKLRREVWMSVPVWRGNRRFHLRRQGDQEHPVLLAAGLDHGSRVLVDPAALDPSALVVLERWHPDLEGKLVAYQTYRNGTEECDLRVLDVDSGEIVESVEGKLRSTPVAWLPGGRSYYYVGRPFAASGRDTYHDRQVWLHHVGARRKDDIPIFGGRRRTEKYSVSVSRDGRWLVVEIFDGRARHNNILLADLTVTGPENPCFMTVGGEAQARSVIGFGRCAQAERFYIKTNLGAGNGRICRAGFADLLAGTWPDLVAEDPGAVLEGYVIMDGEELHHPLLLVVWSRHAVSEVTVHSLRDGSLLDRVHLPGSGCVEGISARPEGGHEAWIAYSDPGRPRVVYRYDARAGELRPWMTPSVGGRPSVATSQVSYKSRDETAVRMLVMSSAVTPGSGPRPTILTGYGGFGVSQRPCYSSAIRAWVDAGGIYAIANLRGGGEEGEAWHRAGIGKNKRKAVDDLQAAAEWLVSRNLTTPGQLGLYGSSNGGLIVGAAVTQRPDLYSAVVCATPLLDMVRYQNYGMGKLWTEEYGNPGDTTQLAWLLDYSPYHNVVPGTDYPAFYFLIAEGDTRVHPMHARKMTAALQYATSSTRPILLHCESGIGHGTRRALSRSIGITAIAFSFLADQLGLTCLVMESSAQSRAGSLSR